VEHLVRSRLYYAKIPLSVFIFFLVFYHVQLALEVSEFECSLPVFFITPINYTMISDENGCCFQLLTSNDFLTGSS